MLSQAHRYVLDMLAAALRPLAPDVQCRGTSDLALGEWKFSGNSVRCRRDHFLYHGTLLYDFPLELIDRCLAMPPRMPDYRAGRPHSDFVANLPAEGRGDLRQSLAAGLRAPSNRATIGQRADGPAGRREIRSAGMERRPLEHGRLIGSVLGAMPTLVVGMSSRENRCMATQAWPWRPLPVIG